MHLLIRSQGNSLDATVLSVSNISHNLRRGLENAASKKFVNKQASTQKRHTDLEHDGEVPKTERAQYQPKYRPKKQAKAKRQEAELYVAIVEEFHMSPVYCSMTGQYIV